MEPTSTQLGLQNINNRYENIKNIISDKKLKGKDFVIESIKREIGFFNQGLKQLNPTIKQNENEFKLLNAIVNGLVSEIKDKGHYDNELLTLEKTMKVFDQKISKNLEYLIYVLGNESPIDILKLIPQFTPELFFKKDEYGDTAFHIAFKNKTGIEVLKAMINHAGIVGVLDENREGLSVLDLAAEGKEYTAELKSLLQLVDFKKLNYRSQVWIRRHVLKKHDDCDLIKHILKNTDLNALEFHHSNDLPLFDLLKSKQDFQALLPFFPRQSFYTRNLSERTILQEAFIKGKLDLKTLEIMCACGGKEILDAEFFGEKNKGLRGATILDIAIEKIDVDLIKAIVQIKGLENLTKDEFFSIWNLALANRDLRVYSIIKDSKILNYDQSAKRTNPEEIQVWRTESYFTFYDGILKKIGEFENNDKVLDDLICFAKDVNNWTKDKDGNTFLHILLQTATPSPLLQKLLETGAGSFLSNPYNQETHDGDLILHPDALEELVDDLSDPENTSPLKELLPELKEQLESGDPLMLKPEAAPLIKKLLDAGADPFIFNNISPLFQKLLEMDAGSFLNDPYNQKMDNGDLVLHPGALKELVDDLSDPQNTSPLKELLPELKKQLESGDPLILNIEPLSKKLLKMGAGSFLNDPYNQEMKNGDLILHPDALKELVDDLSDPQNTSRLKKLLPELKKQLESGAPLILKSGIDPLSKDAERDPFGLSPYDMILENEMSKKEYLPYIAQMKSLYNEK